MTLCRSHGRDNKLHYFELPNSAHSIPSHRSTASTVPSIANPTQGITALWNLDVNAMAYCNMSLLSLGRDSSGNETALVAVPALTKDVLVSAQLRLKLSSLAYT